MKNRNLYWIVGVIVLIIIILLLIFRGFNGGEDNWIKDLKGVWSEHGNPSSAPDYVKEQKDAVFCAKNKYSLAKDDRMNFSSQCLGRCENFSVDIVHVPRNAEDDLAVNQCSDYKIGITKNFIELDKNGEIVRVV
jgi:hypothetical protein